MPNEGIRKVSKPSPEELRLASEAYKEADPTTYSALIPQAELTQTGIVEYTSDGDPKEKKVFEREGDVFYEIDENPAFQQAVTRFLKGIINVSDVVAVSGEKGLTYYSKHIPLERVIKQESQEEITADKELLYLIFGDKDRIIPTDEKEALNMRIEDSKVAFFDFGDANFEPWYGGMWNKERMSELSEDSLLYLKGKLSQLKERFLSAEGRTFAEQIYNSIKKNRRQWLIPIADDSFDKFYGTLERRINGSIWHVDQILIGKQRKEAA